MVAVTTAVCTLAFDLAVAATSAVFVIVTEGDDRARGVTVDSRSTRRAR